MKQFDRLDENGRRKHRQGRYAKWGEPSVAMRVPVSMHLEILELIKSRGYKKKVE